MNSQVLKDGTSFILEKLVENRILFNDRIGRRVFSMEPSFRVFSDRFIPIEYTENWQHINTIGVSWGYNKEQSDKHYKSGQDLRNLVRRVTDLGGSILLNIATDETGRIDPREQEALYLYKRPFL
jgi:alpha-L-fucosidase